MTYANGDKYEGSWRSGQRHGFGVLFQYESGQHYVSYRGEWKRDMRDVRFLLFFPDTFLFGTT